jgi:predicted phosphodiesterase
MTRITFVGDPHGDTSYISNALVVAERDNADVLCLLGDNALHTGFYNQLSFDARQWSIDIICIPGNHDHWDYLDSLLGDRQMHQRTWGMFEGVEIHKRVFYIPPASIGIIDGLRFLFVGGSFSIDYEWRKAEDEMNNIRSLWFPQEMVTDAEVERSKAFGKVDVLVTHDATNLYKMEGESHSFPASVVNRERISTIARATRPSLQVHGHWHRFYEKKMQMAYDNNGEMDWWELDIVGLDCNFNWNISESVRTYDTQTGWVGKASKLAV